MIIYVLFNPHSQHQRYWCCAFAQGLSRHGLKVYVVHQLKHVRKCDFVACWGWRTGSKLKSTGHLVLMVERGFLGDRIKTWASLGWNGLNNRATFPLTQDSGERFQTHFGESLKTWREPNQGKYALVLGQNPGDMSLAGRDAFSLVKDYCNQLKMRGIEPRVRWHPVHQQPERTLDEDFENAEFSVTFNSNSAVDSVLAGVPCVTHDEGAMSWNVTSHSLDESLVRPNRERWLAWLAWTQWQIAEMKSGAAWDVVRHCDVWD